MNHAHPHFGVIAAVAIVATWHTTASAQNDESTTDSSATTVLEQYQQRRAALNRESRDEWYNLASWLMEQRKYDLVLKEVDELLERYPDENRGWQLREILLKRKPNDQTPRRNPTLKPKTPRTGSARRKDERLTKQQINLIKLWELDFSTRPHVIVPRKTIDELFKKYAHRDLVPTGTRARRRFRGLKDYEQARLLRKLDARDLMKQVHVADDPPALLMFRNKIHLPYVISYCGTRHCHGGDEAKALWLTRAKPKEERTAYTNFLILNAYESSTGYMIDRDKPDLSLLTQFGLPSDESRMPHPKTRGWKAHYYNRDDPRFVRTIRWIRSLARPLIAKNYGVAYTIPKAPGIPKDSPATNVKSPLANPTETPPAQ